MAKFLTPIKAIRAKCLDCSCDSANEVRQCPITDCALYPYRLGKNPNINKREYTEEQRTAMRERAKALKLTKNTTQQSLNKNGLPKTIEYTTKYQGDKKDDASPVIVDNTVALETKGGVC